MKAPLAKSYSSTFRSALPYWLKSFLYHYPFTLAGSTLLAAALFLLGRSLAQENPYALLLALLGLIVLAALAVTGRLQAKKFRAHLPQWHWDTSVPLYARRAGLDQALISDPTRTLPFFRVHFLIWGKLTVGRGGATIAMRREISFSAGIRHPIPLYFPLCGLFSCRGRFSLRDIFGLSRARFGEDLPRQLSVQPASATRKSITLVEPSVGFEETSRKRSSEEEKYYMREYLPGDRFRDINWKVSSRLAELITRISPITQEKTTIVPVVFRNFRDKPQESVESVAHLNVLKGWLIAFLRAMKQEHPEMQFRVSSGSDTWLLAGEEDIDRFSWELTGVFFQSETGASARLPGEEELFIFSTVFDRGLPFFLASQAQARVYLFRTVAAPEDSRPLVLFQPPCPCLPGAWALRKERKLAQVRIPAPVQGKVEEQPLSVRLL